jgi:metallo-beta-lactamase family protein
MELEFYGAAGEVTGSCHLLRVAGRQVLLDCGLVQGGRDASQRNRLPFPFEVGAIDAVILSHAHIDHCGRLPLLVKRGFRGPIYTNPACRDLLPIMLRDTADLSAREAERANKRRERDGRDGGGRDRDAPVAEPLYDLEDVEQTLRLVRAVRYDVWHEPFPGLALRQHESGHILGSASIELRLREGEVERTLVFSGDLGQYGSPILLDPHRFESADAVVMESTYGGRAHRDRKATVDELGSIIAAAARDQGNIIVPAFAVGRSQELLYLLATHFEAWHLRQWQVFLDSPMAIEASEVYWRHADRHDEEALRLRRSFGKMPPLDNLHLCRTADESRAINALRAHALVIAGSGMCNGGRVLHHLRNNLGRRECHVVITGFQAPGTLGRALVDREPFVRIHGLQVRVEAQVHTLGGLSAHGDREDLLRWYGSFAQRPPVWLVHGEPDAAHALRDALGDQGVQATVATPGRRIDLAALPRRGLAA